jgi:hypothetical protein
MDMDQAAVWLAGSILFSLGAVTIVAGIVVVNNILSKYWKPVRMFTSDSWTIGPSGHTRFATPEELAQTKSNGPEFKEPVINWPTVPEQTPKK